MQIKKLIFALGFIASAFANQVYEEPATTAQPSQYEVPAEPPGTSVSSALNKMVITLAALLILFGVSYWLLKRMGRNRLHSQNSLKAIKIRERRPISPKTTLYIIELAGKEILIAESQLDVRTLASYEWPDEEPLPKKT